MVNDYLTCANNNLIVSNSWFQHKSIHQLTWCRNGDCSQTGHMIDPVLINRKFPSSMLDTRVSMPPTCNAIMG